MVIAGFAKLGTRSKGKCLLIFLFLFFLPEMGSTEVAVETDSGSYCGKVIKVTESDVYLESGFNVKPKTLGKTELKAIRFDAPCTFPISTPISCNNLRFGYRVTVAGMSKPISAEQFSMIDDSTYTLLLTNGIGQLYVDVAKIKKIERVCVDTKSEPIFNPGRVTDSICYEPRQWAVNWSPSPVYNNDIFTKGFSFYLGTEINSTHTVKPPDVRLAFGTALSMWTTGLERIKNELPPELKNYLKTITSQSENYRLLTPPQVLQVFCEQTGMFLIEWVTGNDKYFTDEEDNFLAKAHLKGRSVFINAKNHFFASDLHIRATKDVDTNALNLATLMAHELGHAFGLPDQSAGASIMANHWSRITLEPTDSDARALAEILSKAIKGAKAGVFDSTNCAGLKE